MNAPQMPHAYVVPAYGDSPYLDACLASLAAQRHPSPVIVSASKPGPRVRALADRHGVRYVEHDTETGIGRDWNKALAATNAQWVTLAHQDDVYLPEFGERVLAAARRVPEALLISTDYAELVGQDVRNWTPRLIVKRILIEVGYLGRPRVSRAGAKRRLLRFGCPIACPAVTLRASSVPGFDERMRTNLDWDAWLRLSGIPGSFAHIRTVLMHHRIHAGAETSEGLRSGVRAQEDLEMFSRLWPAPIARALTRLYALGYGGGAS